MNAVEIEAAVAALAGEPFDRSEFPFQFLGAFGFKETTLRKLRKGSSNASDVGGVLLRNHIHLRTCEPGATAAALDSLRTSPRSVQARAKFLFATDGEYFEAVQTANAEHVADALGNLANHFGFFLPLAGITTVREIKDNPIDVRATGRLNKLYLELLKLNPEWGAAARRHEMNHFMARLIFCFFAQNTGIFRGHWMFTQTVEQFTEADGSNTHLVLGELFRAMNLSPEQRLHEVERLPGWADYFPFVNGGLFGDSIETPKFSRIARSFLLEAGRLDWQKINPDIFGSMIQAVAEDEERGALGMHYTSVPNILKVLNPLFLDELNAKLEEAGTSPAKLRRLRTRLSRIRVFDPACGSGNFLVIAYKRMRAIEAEIDKRLGEVPKTSIISLKNFRGIEIRDFAAEIARLALVIAEYQCNVDHLGEQQAQFIFLPLASENWITCGNALRLDWLKICPPQGTGVKVELEDTLFQDEKEQRGIDFENEGGQTYICGNPPYLGSKLQTPEQKQDLEQAWGSDGLLMRDSDFVTGWIGRFITYVNAEPQACAAFVTTNSICQGQNAGAVWPIAFRNGVRIEFAYSTFKWNNLAAHNAGVTVVILGLSKKSGSARLYEGDVVRTCALIGPYLIPDQAVVISKADVSISGLPQMLFGNMPRDGGNLILSRREMEAIRAAGRERLVMRFLGSEELINGKSRWCLWLSENDLADSANIALITERIEGVRRFRLASKAVSTQGYATKPYRFVQIAGQAKQFEIAVPSVSSESREFLPVEFLRSDTIISNLAFGLYDAPIWNMALIASKLHLVWIATVCGKLKTDFRYSNTLGWNTFPVPPLIEQHKAVLTRCAENILLARERHFPATIADLYDPETMPADLRAAHEENDETLERIYIGRRFRNDTERLETLFSMYTKLMAEQGAGSKQGAGKARAKRRKSVGEQASLLQDKISEVQA